MRIPVLWVTAGAVAFLAARPALANGRFPSSNQIVFSPTDEKIIVGRTTYAILPSNDNGKTWGYLCENALSLPSVSYQDPELALTASNSLVAGLFQPTVGLDVSPDLGCNWNCIGGPLANQQIVDIVVRPDTPHQVLALTGTYGKSADAGTVSQVFQSVDDGTTWTALGTPIDRTAIVATIEVSASDPMRIYVSANRGFGTTRTASLFVSMDDGSTWMEQQVQGFNPSIPCVDAPTTKCQSEDQLFIAAVDPTNADRVYLRSNGLSADTPTPGDSRLYVTPDAGQSFQMVKDFPLPVLQSSDFTQIGELLGFALSPDGSKVFIGTKESGLWSASTTNMTFAQVNRNLHVQCLAARQASTGPELWACSDEVSGFVFGKSTDDGVTFEPMMSTVTSMNGPIACSGSSPASAACFTDANASACSCSGYQMFCSNTEPNNACFGCGQDGGGPPPVVDAGSDALASGDAGGEADASKTTAPGRSSSCGCSVVGGGGAAGFLAGCAIAAVAVRRRRKR